MGKKNFFAQGKYRVRWKNNAVFSLEKTVLDRIPLYKRTVLKEECLYKFFEMEVENNNVSAYLTFVVMLMCYI